MSYDARVRTPLARWAILFVIGAVLGTALDHLHVSFGVLDYPGPHPTSQPFWVPPLFGSATLLFVSGHRGFRAPGERGTPGRAAFAWLVFALAYLASAALHQWPRALLLGMLLGFIPFVWGPTFLRRAAYALSIALGGFLFESTLVHFGAFRYLAPGPLLVPIWLPGLYLYAAEAARQVQLAYYSGEPSR